MSYSDYGASISDYDTTDSRPDRALVVECKTRVKARVNSIKVPMARLARDVNGPG